MSHVYWGSTPKLLFHIVLIIVRSLFSFSYCDIWGPIRLNSTLDFEGFVTSIDDFSRFTWMYLMKEHFELFSIFQTLCAEIKTSLVFLFAFFVVIMHANIYHLNLNYLCISMDIFIKLSIHCTTNWDCREKKSAYC